jgi:Protein of unknown function (DUF4446)
VVGIFLYVNPHVLSVTGLLLGALGICFGVVAYVRSSRTVHQCTALVQGSVGSRGTVDPRALRDVAIVRYDALNEMSGQLSFSLALLNAVGDGVVVSSINGRAETRTYAKVVLSGKGTQELSPEERHAVRQARLGMPSSPSANGERRAVARGALPDVR